MLIGLSMFIFSVYSFPMRDIYDSQIRFNQRITVYGAPLVGDEESAIMIGLFMDDKIDSVNLRHLFYSDELVFTEPNPKGGFDLKWSLKRNRKLIIDPATGYCVFPLEANKQYYQFVDPGYSRVMYSKDCSNPFYITKTFPLRFDPIYADKIIYLQDFKNRM
jgi:hypothetical protein